MNFARVVRWTVLGLAALCPAAAWAQDAGRVLAAAGEVSVLRGGQERALAAGAALRSGDVVRTGAASSAQLGFSDGGIVALRSRSRFEIATYRFSGADDGVSEAAFRLLQGGLRTLTGMIGRALPARYRMSTPLASVGIRGTTYGLVHCNDDCEEDDGTLAPDGSYGVVFEGRVVVANAGGEREFGADEAFFVPDAATPPQPLLSRPRFLRDRLEARARREERREARREALEATAQAFAQRREQSMAALAARAAALDPRNVAVIGTPVSPIVVADLRDASGNVALLGAGLGAAVGFGTAATPFALVDGGQGTVVQLDAERGTLERFAFNGGAQGGDRNGAAVLDRGFLSGDGGGAWGRWAPGGAVQLGGVAGVPSTGVHFLFGNLTPEALFANVPSAATGVRYEYHGGPSPTDEHGNAGHVVGGSFLVNFVDRSIAGGLAYTVGDITYALPVPQGTPLVAGRGFVGFAVDREGAGGWTCACSGATGTLDRYSVSGLFLGSRAQGIGVAFGTHDADVGRTAGAGLFRCVSGGCR